MKNAQRILVGCGVVVAGVVGPVGAAAQSTLVQTAPPFVDISLLGSDALYRPGQISYRVTADPGSYVTVFLISPRGRRIALNSYERAFEGSKRRELIRETATGFETGESYLVAVATRNRLHSTTLVRQSENAARLASGYLGAEASLNELLFNIVPAIGNDFAATYVSFRVLSRGVPTTLAFYRPCGSGSFSSEYGFFGDVFYRGRLEDPFGDESIFGNPYFGYLDQLHYRATCEDRLIVPRLIAARAPMPMPNPQPPRDTTTMPVDSVQNPLRPDGRRRGPPVDPHPIGVDRERGNR